MRTFYITLLLSVFISATNSSYAQDKPNPETELVKCKKEVTKHEETIKDLKLKLSKAQQEKENYASQNAQLGTKFKSELRTVDSCTQQNSKLQQELNTVIQVIRIKNDSLQILLAQQNSRQQSVKDCSKEKKKLEEISQYCPIIIKSLKVGNIYNDYTVETEFGNILYSSNSMFLSPQIEYIGLKPNQTITLFVKLYENGNLRRNSETSPDGYSYKKDIYISEEGKSMVLGWGGEKKGNWPKGNYRFEIWYNNVCLKAEDFTLY